MSPSSDVAEPLDGHALERLSAQRALHTLLDAWSSRLAGLVRIGARDQARWAVLRAIRLDLPLLVAEPDLIFPCVANRVLWPWRESVFERARRGLGGSSPAEVLSAFVEDWRASRRSRGLGGWARSLRRPELGLDAPLLEEYRGAFSRFEPLHLELGSVRVGWKEAMGWDRATGRTLPPAPSPPDRLLADHTPGAIRVEGALRLRDITTGEVVVDTVLQMDMGAFFNAFRPTASRAIFVVGWEDDAVGLICRLDPPYRRQTWRTHTRRMAFDVCATPDGEQVFVAADTLVMLDGVNGAIRHEGALPCSRVALDPSGRALGTLSNGLVRIWDVQRLGAVEAPPPGVKTNGVRCFSADGRRLLTGSVLCDGRDGRPIATLDLDDGSAYLEGGPPRGGTGFSPTEVIEIGAVGGVRRWDAESGALTSQRRHGGEGLGRIVAIHPQGERYAVGALAGSAPLRILRTSDGAEVGAIGLGALSELRYTPDGRWLVAITDRGEVVVLDGSSGVQTGRLQAHTGRVRQALISADSALLVTVGEDPGLALHGLDPLRLLGHRPGPLADPLEIEGWEGFRSTPHRWVGRPRGAVFEVVDRETGARVAAIPTPEALVSDPSGTRWAGGSVHVALEDLG